ncbi:hypothetical protein Ssi03_66140 [Sphaerisporangium siamense]|uniref:Phosphatidylserine/phosphatidylglycerophosphate/ cardiolipin synthase family protein n=1 Tax=Sphaerisporangium siamense TaxID=795645 RepID=A0A7W7DG66_9ACTN|nr:hypothetical protein [Sphaerisporangium siamense]MBB4706021.1 hypothetical protein [Sphaerisporangium siamense]GII88624.1 hypothetical protein Ssi03_66140 [Sphaerisporangium siamense]
MNDGPRKPSPMVVPKIVRKLLITGLIGGASYLVTNAFIHGENEDVWSMLLAIFISGVVFVVQFLIDVDVQLDIVRDEQRVHHGSTHRLVTEGFSRINEAGELYGLVESSAMRTEAVTRFVRCATKIGDDLPELMRNLVHHEIERLSKLLQELGDTGRAFYEGEDREWLLALALKAQVSLDAISLSSVDARDTEFAGGFWVSDLGQRYIKIQRDLVLRGVRARRIFVVDRSEWLDSEQFRRVWKLQTEVGIDVRVLTDEDTPMALGGSLCDFIIFDRSVYYESNPAPQRTGITPTIASTVINARPEKVREGMERFEDLWRVASPRP